MRTKLLVAMVTLCSWAVPLPAQTPPPVQLQIESDRQANLQVQQAVSTTWRLPRLTADATVRVRARVLLSGALVDPQIEIEGGTDEENENLRRSVEEAIGRTVVSIPPREIDFVLEANTSAHLPRCFPLRVYIFDGLRDSLEPPPPTSTQAMRLAVTRWHRILASYTDDKQAPPLTIVDDPEQADVWIEPYEKYDDFSAYLIDERSGRAVVRIPLKYPRTSVLQTVYLWWPPEVVTQQTMFQLGRLLGLGLSDAPSNVMFAGHSNFIASSSAFERRYVPSRSAVSTFSGLAFGGDAGQSSGLIASLLGYPASPQELAESGRADRTISSTQIENVLDLMRDSACPERSNDSR